MSTEFLSRRFGRRTLFPDAPPARRCSHARPGGSGVEGKRVEVVRWEQFDAVPDDVPTLNRHDAPPAPPLGGGGASTGSTSDACGKCASPGRRGPFRFPAQWERFAEASLHARRGLHGCSRAAVGWAIEWLPDGAGNMEGNRVIATSSER